jgi:phosphoglycerate dehydrogenase-like enzyme
MTGDVRAEDATSRHDGRRPKVVLAMWPGLEAMALGRRARQRLDAVADVLDERPIGSFDDERAPALLAEADVLLTHWGAPVITGEVVAAAPRLRLVAHGAGTVKDLVTPAVFDAGITVTSAAAANAMPVAEYALAAILWANKDVFAGARLLRGDADPDGWRHYARTAGNVGKRIGIVGASLVGRRLIELLQPFDLRVAVYDPFLGAAEATALGVELVDDLVALCAECDVLSLHAPSLPTTRHMVGVTELAALPDGAWLVNTARGALVDHDALIAEVRTGRINAVLDVTDPEPLSPDSALLHLPNVIVTPHVAGAQGNELLRLADLVVGEIERYAAGEPPRWPVTAADWDRIA